MTRQQFEARIISKAWKDEAFRKRLLADPKAVMAEELASLHEKANLPDNVKVTVMEETADQIYLVRYSPKALHLFCGALFLSRK